jgi:transposase
LVVGRRWGMEVVAERCAGIDVGKREVQASIRVPDGQGGRRKETRTYSTFTSSVEAMAQWLGDEGVTEVVMESTGSFWKPIWYVLEDRGFELKLVNSRHVKMVPGRKTDVKDAEWLAELLEHGLLRGSFVPPPAIRKLRDLTRYRKRLIQTRAVPTSASGSRRPWRTPASSWLRSPPTSWGCRAPRC